MLWVPNMTVSILLDWSPDGQALVSHCLMAIAAGCCLERQRRILEMQSMQGWFKKEEGFQFRTRDGWDWWMRTHPQLDRTDP